MFYYEFRKEIGIKRDIDFAKSIGVRTNKTLARLLNSETQSAYEKFQRLFHEAYPDWIAEWHEGYGQHLFFKKTKLKMNKPIPPPHLAQQEIITALEMVEKEIRSHLGMSLERRMLGESMVDIRAFRQPEDILSENLFEILQRVGTLKQDVKDILAKQISTSYE